MRCELAQKQIALVIYDEVSDAARRDLEEHLSGCAECRKEFEAVESFHAAMSLAPAPEPSANLLARARIGFGEAIDSSPDVGWIERAWEALAGDFAAFVRAPLAAALLLLVGLGAGGFSGYQAARAMKAGPQASSPAGVEGGSPNGAPVRVAGVSSIVRNPNSDEVEVRYDRIVPQMLRGRMDDPRIHELLVLGAQDRWDPNVEENSVGLLAEDCRAGRGCGEGPVRTALLGALRYDGNPTARLNALNGLEPYVGEDIRVRDAILEALMDDPDPAVRSRAIELLEPVQVDTSVREALNTVASEDENPHIRTVSREVLDQMPQIE